MKSEVTGLGGLISSSAVWATLSVSVMSGDFPISATRMEEVRQSDVSRRNQFFQNHGARQ